jgi:CBS domain-containing protein
MLVGEVMTRDVTAVSTHATVREAAQQMDQLNVGALPVCEGQRLVGMITDRDITVRCTAAGSSPDATQVNDVMSGDVRWCREDDQVAKATEEMSHMQVRRLPVVDRGQNLVGIVSLGDLATRHAPGTGETLRSISEPSMPDRSGGPGTTGGIKA